jgi:hypothetical protein
LAVGTRGVSQKTSCGLSLASFHKEPILDASPKFPTGICVVPKFFVVTRLLVVETHLLSPFLCGPSAVI